MRRRCARRWPKLRPCSAILAESCCGPQELSRLSASWSRRPTRTPRGNWPSGSPNRSATSAEISWNRQRFAGVLACMGQPDVARVDVAALHAVARQYETVADIVESVVRTHLTGLAFDGAVAGRTHVARGDALRAA